MSYATIYDLLALQPKETLLQLSDDDGDGDFAMNPDNTAYKVVMSAVTETAALVDGYIGTRCELPLTAPYPRLIVEITANLALCKLYDRRRELDAPEGIENRRKRYMAMLKDISAEKLIIPELQRVAATPQAAMVHSRAPVFNATLLSRM